MSSSRKSSGTEAYYRAQHEIVSKEAKALRQKAEKLDRENRDLKKSVFELSYRLHLLQQQLSKSGMQPFNIDAALGGGGLHSDSVLDPAHVDREAAGIPRERADEDGKLFAQKYELKGHTGAVYVAKFSPCGRLLSSGSFDQTVRVWDMTSHLNQHQASVLADHKQVVADLSWSNDSHSLLSASYDHSVKRWDVEGSSLLDTYKVQGFAQCVGFNPADNNIFATGTTQKKVYIFDSRSPEMVSVWKNDAMVNTLHLCKNGQKIIAGDSQGMIKTWDLRKSEPLDEWSHLNDEGHHSITHIHASPATLAGGNGEQEERFLAVNSYDNILRVYDRGSLLLSHLQARSAMHLVHQLKGHRNKSWPIRSSFFMGASYRVQAARPPYRTPGSIDGEETEIFGPEAQFPGDARGNLQEAMLLATGSADNRVYIYDVSGPEGTGTLLQRLDGHSDRVYSVDFHPSEPLLVSGSADFTLRVWGPKSSSRVPTPPLPPQMS